ncbi:MAG: RNA 2'-phosphotransferase [Planctomycetaceae bacterium]|nr:RNA 2'-phosphotransferase [Planctomycetaceae bacterium]
MDAKRHKRISKFLSLVLRHRPELIGIDLDGQGWVSVQELLTHAHRQGTRFSEAELRQVVRESDKQRFALSDDGLLIRANQGHSVSVDLGLEPSSPPEVLYHGTVATFLTDIREKGLLKGQRHHVHLSPDKATATKVGSRRGKPVILEIASQQMHADGLEFYLSTNGVWLTDHVPPSYIFFPGDN